MAIYFNEETRIFTIQTKNSTYAMKIAEYNLLSHLYYGEKIDKSEDLSYLANNSGTSLGNFYDEIGHFTYEKRGVGKFTPHALRQEYSTFGLGDYRTPCLLGRFSDGSAATDLRYKSHKIIEGKPALAGLPSFYANENERAQTLVITLKDKVYDLYVELYYSIIEGHNEIMRSAKIINKTGGDYTIESALSICLDLNMGDLDAITFYGQHNNERHAERKALSRARLVVNSVAGATSHFTNNSIILCEKNADENKGQCYGLSLVYSGNFSITAEKDHYGRTRLCSGISPEGFNWHLSDDEEFTTPEAIISYSANGLGELSRGFHDIIRYNLCRGKYKDSYRPVLINNWEATMFEFDEQKLLDFADKAKAFGAQMLVVDDGWFGKRDWDDSSLGDWFVDKSKLPNGVEGLYEKLKEKDMFLGLWFEPENISENSELYRAHPDYAIRVPSRAPMRCRWQLALDMSRKEIRDNIFEQMKKVLSSCPVKYVKWDMNRNITDAFSRALPAERQGEFYHRFILGVYDLMERITAEFPDILLENCSGGGGRFDLGMLYYSPQIWTSDNTDAFCRLKIQYGTSFIYPVSCMGAHIAVSPSLPTGVDASVLTRGAVAMAGTFGFELDPSHEDEKSCAQMAFMTSLYKKHYFTINHGDYYRLASPYENRDETSRISAWQFVSKDKNNALFTVVQLDAPCDSRDYYLKLYGLDESKKYKLTRFSETGGQRNSLIRKTGMGVFGGAALVKAGLHLNIMGGNNRTILIEIEAV